MTTYQIKTPVFEGPLELLLEFIEKRKLEINQVNLAAVTDDFLNHLKTASELKLGDISQFILVAATLILIKSKSLLPAMALSEEEESTIAELEERLRRFQIIKSVLPALKTAFGQQVIFNRSGVPFIPVFVPDPAANLPVLRDSLRRAFDEMPKKEFLPQVPVRRVVSLEDLMRSLVDRIEKGLQMTFRDFTKGNFKSKQEEKFYLVVSFLALLELVNQGLIEVSQGGYFGEIAIEKPKAAIAEEIL